MNCIDADRRTSFSETSGPTFMGETFRDGRMNSRAVAGFAEDKQYEVFVGNTFFVEPALGVKVTAIVHLSRGSTEAWAAPLGGIAEAGVSLKLTVRRTSTRDIISTEERILDRRNTPGFYTSRSLHRDRIELSCFGEFGTQAANVFCSVTLHTWATAGAIAGATAQANVDVESITLERCCVRPLEAPEGMIPLFRWYSRNRQDNFMTSQTAWVGCRGSVRNPDYTFSRFEGFVHDPQRPRPSGTLPLFSWWNPDRKDNFITSDPRWGERTPNPEPGGYTRYRLEGYVFDPKGRTDRRPAEAVPLYRWWNPNRKDNFTTSDPRWLRHMDVNDIVWNGEHIANGPEVEGYRLSRLEGFVLG